MIESLSQNILEEAQHYCRILFDRDPTNPTVLSVPLQIFDEQSKSFHLIEFFNNLTGVSRNPEVLGNIYLHLANVLMINERLEEARKNLDSALANFEKVFSPDHYVFKEIKAAMIFLSD